MQRCREAADRRGEAKALGALGHLALLQGEVPAARLLLAEALRAFQRFEMRAEIIASVEDHAGLALALGQPEPAACLLATATQARGALGLPRAPDLQVRCLALRDALLSQLGDWGLSVAEAAGAASSLSDAAQAALALQALEQA